MSLGAEAQFLALSLVAVLEGLGLYPEQAHSGWKGEHRLVGHYRVNQLCRPAEARYSVQPEVMIPAREGHTGCSRQKKVCRKMLGLEHPTTEKSLVEEHQPLVGVGGATCRDSQWGVPLGERCLQPLEADRKVKPKAAPLGSEAFDFWKLAWQSHQVHHSSSSCS